MPGTEGDFDSLPELQDTLHTCVTSSFPGVYCSSATFTFTSKRRGKAARQYIRILKSQKLIPFKGPRQNTFKKLISSCCPDPTVQSYLDG